MGLDRNDWRQFIFDIKKDWITPVLITFQSIFFSDFVQEILSEQLQRCPLYPCHCASSLCVVLNSKTAKRYCLLKYSLSILIFSTSATSVSCLAALALVLLLHSLFYLLKLVFFSPLPEAAVVGLIANDFLPVLY